MSTDIEKISKLQSQISKDLSKIRAVRAKTNNSNLHLGEESQLERLLLKTMNLSSVNVDIKSLRGEFKQIKRQLQESTRVHKGKVKERREFLKDLKKLQKEEKKHAISNIMNKFESAKTEMFKENANLDELKMDVFHNDDTEISSEDLERILDLITEQSLLSSKMVNNEIIRDIGTYKLNNKICLPIVHTFTNYHDLRRKLNNFGYNNNNNNNNNKYECFELIQIIDCNSKEEEEQCNLMLNSSGEWIKKDNIWVNNQLRSKLRELFLSNKYKNELCPIGIRKFYCDTYFGGKYSIYGKHITQIKSICYRSIVESFRDEAFNKHINNNEIKFMYNKFKNNIILDPFAGTGNWAMIMAKLIESKQMFLWEIEKNVHKTIVDNNKHYIDNGVLYAFNQSFELIPQIVHQSINNNNNNNGVLILLSPPWGKAFKPGIGIDLTKGEFPIINLLKFYENVLNSNNNNNNNKLTFVVQVDKNISNFGDILSYYDIVLRNEQLLILEKKNQIDQPKID